MDGVLGKYLTSHIFLNSSKKESLNGTSVTELKKYLSSQGIKVRI